MANPTITQLAADLAAGRTTSRQLTEEALARIADPKGEGSRAFVKVWKDQALAAADASDGLRTSTRCTRAPRICSRWAVSRPIAAPISSKGASGRRSRPARPR